MGQLKQFESTIELGKRLVKELGLDESVDTLGRWMAHHIAEPIEQAEQAKYAEQTVLQDRCRSAILALWDHVNVLPIRPRPFEDLEPIIATIRALDPDDRAYFYQTRAQEVADSLDISGSAKEWLKLSRGIDHSARLLVDMCISKAVTETSGKAKEWIELAAKAGANELPVVEFVSVLEGEGDVQEDGNEKRISKLKERLERLHGLVSLSDLLAKDIETEIESLNG